MIDVKLEAAEVNLIMNLMEEMRKPVPQHLHATFYRTLRYNGDVKLKEIADRLANKITAN